MTLAQNFTIKSVPLDIVLLIGSRLNRDLKKFLPSCETKVYTYEKQASFVTIVQDGSNAEVLNYGRVEST